MHYVGTLDSDGSKFDSSRDRDEPFTFKLGQGQVIKGWDASVATMKKGEQATVIIRGDYAYGAAGSPPKIPADATLRFDIELLSWRSSKDLMGDGGIIKTVAEEGDGWQQPGRDDELEVEYAVTAGDRQVYASEGAATLALARVEEDPSSAPPYFCRALAEALPKMKKGERVSLRVRADYGPRELDGDVTISARLVDWKKVERLPGGVVKKTLEATDEWKTPRDGATVSLALVGRVAGSDKEFIRYERDAPLSCEVGGDALPEGLEQAVMKMKSGERCVVFVPAASGYGAEGDAALGVPGGADLEYEVTLLSLDNPKDTWELSHAEQVEVAARRKERGNASWKAGRVARAVRQWTSAEEGIKYDKEFDADAKAAARTLKKSLLLNLAAAHLKLADYGAARKAADEVLAQDSLNAKALYRRAQASMGLGDYVEAEVDIKAGLSLEPADRDFLALKRRLKVQSAAVAKKEAKMFGRMFARMAQEDAGKAEDKAAGEEDKAEERAAEAETAEAPVSA